MKETERIRLLLSDLYNGKPWIDVNISDTLSAITAEQAAKKLSTKWNSIWEITNHVLAWRRNALQRVQGIAMQTPVHNYFMPVTDTSAPAWQNTLLAFEDSQRQWLDFLNTFDEQDFENRYKPHSLTYYQHIHGVLQHDAYHLGQIVMLAKHA